VKNPLNGYTWWHAAKSLGIIGQNNPVAIEALVEFIGTCQNELIRRQAAKSLGIISQNNPVAIAALVEFIGTCQKKVAWA
jgi:HEAT repeat protein